MKLNQPLKIMLADDDPDDREFLEFLFDKNEKFQIIGCFTSAEEVMEEIESKKNIPDILLIDLYLPLMSGSEVLTHLIQKQAAPEMFTFIISGIINLVEEEKYLDNLNVKFLKKPTTLAEINDLPGIILECLNFRNNTRV